MNAIEYNQVEKVLARREAAYERALVKCAKISVEIEAYKKANGGFVSYDLLDAVSKAEIFATHKSASLAKALRAA